MKEVAETVTNPKLKLIGTYRIVIDSQVKAKDKQIEKFEERIGNSTKKLVFNLVGALKERGLELPESVVLDSEISDPKGMFQEEIVCSTVYLPKSNQLIQTERTIIKTESYRSGHSFGVDIPQDEQKEIRKKTLVAKDWTKYAPKIIDALEALAQSQK